MKIPKDINARIESINTNKSMLIVADAGCGKTEQMARRYLALLANRKNPEGILSITFTKKAASEMRERIHKYLKMGCSDAMPTQAHLIETWELAKKAIEADSVNKWEIINNPHKIKIKTIDSFCIDIVNNNVLLNSYGCQIKALEDTAKTYEIAARNYITNSKDIDTISTLIRFFDNNQEKAIKKIAELLPKREQYKKQLADFDAEKLQENFISAFKYELNEFAKTLGKSICNDIRSVIQQINESIEHSVNTNISDEIREQFSNYNENIYTNNLVLFCNIIITNDKRSFRKKFTKNTHVNDYTKHLIEVILEETQLTINDAIRIGSIPLEKMTSKTTSEIEILKTVLSGAITELENHFKQTLELDFNEITLEAIKVVQSSPCATSNLTDLLIDEFQDTSASHHTLIESIIEWWEPRETKTICAVGDPKQSLYLFRAASLGHFINVQHNGYKNRKLSILKLSVNFRSFKSVINWVNNTFETAFPKNDNISQGAVKHSFSEAFNTTEIESVKVIPTLCTGDKFENEKKEAILVADQIEHYLKTVPQETVSILIRARSFIKEIDIELKSRGVFYTGIDLVKLNEKQEIIDLINLTKTLAKKEDMISFAGLLRAPFIGILQKDLHIIITGLSNSKIKAPIIETLSEIIDELSISKDAKQRLSTFINKINKSSAIYEKIPFSNYLEYVWSELGGDQFTCDLQEADIRAFFKAISNCESENTIHDWTLLDTTLDKLYMQPDENADQRVQVMTLHKSKGAEMDNVIIPGFHKPGTNPDSSILKWIDHPDPNNKSTLLAPNIELGLEKYKSYINISNRNKEILEMVRLIYVGATRAKKRLCVFFSVTEEILNGQSRPSSTSMLGLIHDEINQYIKINPETEDYLNEKISKLTKPKNTAIKLARYKQNEY